MKTTTIPKMSVLFLFVLSVVSCKGNKGGLDNQESDTVMVAKDSIPFVLKHLDVDKKKVMAYVTCSEQTQSTLYWQLLIQRTAKLTAIVWKIWAWTIKSITSGLQKTTKTPFLSLLPCSIHTQVWSIRVWMKPAHPLFGMRWHDSR